MKIGFVPENLTERLAKIAGLVPVPLLDTFHTMLYARMLMAATKVGVFEALEKAPATVEEVAERCGTDPRATTSLLDAVTGIGYLRFSAGRYALAPSPHKEGVSITRITGFSPLASARVRAESPCR